MLTLPIFRLAQNASWFMLVGGNRVRKLNVSCLKRTILVQPVPAVVAAAHNNVKHASADRKRSL